MVNHVYRRWRCDVCELLLGKWFAEESVTWHCDEEWREAYIKLSKEDYRNSTQWKRPLLGRPHLLGAPFYAFLRGCLDLENQGMQYVG